MHGDEPTATAALVDIFNYLVSNPHSPFVSTLHDSLEILAIPMLNPDGAERFQRRNAQGIDINRDVRELQTPEGRILKAIWERFHPHFGFNLHDQDRRMTIGQTKQIIAVALMAPPFDTSGRDNPVRLRAKKVVSVIYQALSPHIYGHIARYKAPFMPRAFGDAMQSWGTSTVLLESGGWIRGTGRFLIRLNFVGLLSAFYAIATGSYEEANPGLYEALPKGDERMFDRVILNGTVINGLNKPGFQADIAINFEQAVDSLGHIHWVGKIADIGDLEVFAAKDTIDASHALVTPGWIGFSPQLTLSEILNPAKLQSFLKEGFTTILGVYPIQGIISLAQDMEEVYCSGVIPNFGLLADVASVDPHYQLSQLIEAMAQGALGIWARPNDQQAQKVAQWFQRPFISEVRPWELEWNGDLSYQNIFRMSGKRAKALRLPNRGPIQIGNFADLLIFERVPGERGPVFEMTYVLVNGHVVVERGRLREIPSGQKLIGSP